MDKLIAVGFGGLFILGLFGWINNIILIIQSDTITGMIIARVCGVFIAPLGAILGWI